MFSPAFSPALSPVFSPAPTSWSPESSSTESGHTVQKSQKDAGCRLPVPRPGESLVKQSRPGYWQRRCKWARNRPEFPIPACGQFALQVNRFRELRDIFQSADFDHTAASIWAWVSATVISPERSLGRRVSRSISNVVDSLINSVMFSYRPLTTWL